MFFKTISNKRAFSRKSQNEPTAKQQQQVYFSILEAILKPEEENQKLVTNCKACFHRLIKYFKKCLQNKKAKMKLLFLICKRLLQNWKFQGSTIPWWW